jgi:hypothetical protein
MVVLMVVQWLLQEEVRYRCLALCNQERESPTEHGHVRIEIFPGPPVVGMSRVDKIGQATDRGRPIFFQPSHVRRRFRPTS